MLQLIPQYRESTLKDLDSNKNNHDFKSVWRNLYRRIDELFRERLQQSGKTIACCAGCQFCCHIKVDVLPPEVFLIADYIRANFSKIQQEAIVQKAKNNWQRIERMTYREQFFSNIQCPLLFDGKCSVYSVRPAMCRKHHSTLVEPCKNGFENPEKYSEADSSIKEVNHAMAPAIMGALNAFEERGLDMRAFDLNAALTEALTDSHNEKKWRKKKSAFPKSFLAKEPETASSGFSHQ